MVSKNLSVCLSVCFKLWPQLSQVWQNRTGRIFFTTSMQTLQSWKFLSVCFSFSCDKYCPKDLKCLRVLSVYWLYYMLGAELGMGLKQSHIKKLLCYVLGEQHHKSGCLFSYQQVNCPIERAVWSPTIKIIIMIICNKWSNLK